MLLKNKIKIGAAVGASLLTFAAIGTSVGIIENQKTNTQINNNIKTSVIKNDNLNTQSTNYSNYLKDTTLTQVENLINQKVNQQTAMFATLSPNQAKVLQYQQELKQKSTNLAKKIMNGDVSINFLLKEIKDKYNNLLTYKQKEYINQKINQQKYVNNKISMKNRFYQYLSLYASSNQNRSITISQAKSIQQKTANLSYQLKVFAGLSTTAAIASTAIAAAIWAIPFEDE